MHEIFFSTASVVRKKKKRKRYRYCLLQVDNLLTAVPLCSTIVINKNHNTHRQDITNRSGTDSEVQLTEVLMLRSPHSKQTRNTKGIRLYW